MLGHVRCVVKDAGARWFGRGLVALGAGLLACWLWATMDGLAFRALHGRRLDSLLGLARPRPLVEAARASREEARASGLIGRIEIPRLGLSALVIEGTSGRALQRGVGHVKRTAFPGERGNVGLAGHRDTHFRPLKDAAKGDVIRIETPDGVFAYEVESIKVVDPDRGDLLARTERPRLTLVTCYPFYWLGPAPRRFVILARPVGQLEASRLRGGAGGMAMAARHRANGTRSRPPRHPKASARSGQPVLTRVSG